MGAVFAWLLYEQKIWYHRLFWACCIILLLCCPAIVQASSLVALILLCYGKRVEAAAFLFSQYPLLWSPFSPAGCAMLTPVFGAAIFLGAYFVLRLNWSKNILANSIIVGYALSLLVVSNVSWHLDKVQGSDGDSVIGAAIQRIVDIPQSADGQLIYLNEEYVPLELRGTVYLDHDAHTDYDVGNFFQPRPWSHNYLIAGEPIKLAVALDGALMSNLGAKCTGAYGHIVYAMMDGAKICPLSLNIAGHLIFADSDYTSNSLAPYQQHLLRRLAGVDYSWRVFWIIASCLLIWGSIFPIRRETLFMLTGIFCLVWLLPIKGNVRYIGKKHLWPHTTLGEGVVRELQERGRNVVFGDKETELLVVAAGHSASVLATEKVVILEPGASVRLGGEEYKAADVPMGDVNGIIDSRVIMKRGLPCATGIMEVNGIKIMATGSPARLKDLF